MKGKKKEKKIEISVVIPVYNDEKRIIRVLKSLKKQTYKKNFEIIVIDDCSADKTKEIAGKYAKVITNKKNMGPAFSRNKGVKLSKGKIIAFTDSDCMVAENWLEEIEKVMQNKEISALMGQVKIPKSSFIGDSISAIGYPAGGSLGYDKMYEVSKEGLTNHISTCNCAVRKSVFEKEGFFDETYPTPGREDTEFALRIWKNKHKILYAKDVKIIHEPRKNIKSLYDMNFARGRGTYHFKMKVSEMDYFLKLRVWSTMNIMKKNFFSLKFPFICFLMLLSYWAHKRGYKYEEKMMKRRP
jgi:glycosyltransferase involved in cell wall biosynthesis